MKVSSYGLISCWLWTGKPSHSQGVKSSASSLPCSFHLKAESAMRQIHIAHCADDLSCSLQSVDGPKFLPSHAMLFRARSSFLLMEVRASPHRKMYLTREQMSLWFSASLSVAVVYHLPPLTEADDANAHAAERNPLAGGITWAS